MCYIAGYERRESDDNIGSWTTVKSKASWQPPFFQGGLLSLGADNLFDQAPPEDPFLEGWPFYNRALHNPRGRFFYLRGQYDF
jgi:iron complex outermembrane recepter protein